MDRSTKAPRSHRSSAGRRGTDRFSRYTMAAMCTLALAIAWPRDSAPSGSIALVEYLTGSVGGGNPAMTKLGEKWQDKTVFAH